MGLGPGAPGSQSKTLSMALGWAWDARKEGWQPLCAASGLQGLLVSGEIRNLRFTSRLDPPCFLP